MTWDPAAIRGHISQLAARAARLGLPHASVSRVEGALVTLDEVIAEEGRLTAIAVARRQRQAGELNT